MCSQGCCLFQSRNVVCLDHRKPSFCGSQLFLDLSRASQSASHGSGEAPTNTAGTPSPLYVAPAASRESARRHGWYPTRSCLARKSPARRLVAHAHHTAGRCRPVPGGSEARYSWNHGLSWHCLYRNGKHRRRSVPSATARCSYGQTGDRRQGIQYGAHPSRSTRPGKSGTSPEIQSDVDATGTQLKKPAQQAYLRSRSGTFPRLWLGGGLGITFCRVGDV